MYVWTTHKSNHYFLCLWNFLVSGIGIFVQSCLRGFLFVLPIISCDNIEYNQLSTQSILANPLIHHHLELSYDPDGGNL